MSKLKMLGKIVIAFFTGLFIKKIIEKTVEADKMLTRIADEGYETAIDVLFPDNNTTKGKLHYGPVISHEG